MMNQRDNSEEISPKNSRSQKRETSIAPQIPAVVVRSNESIQILPNDNIREATPNKKVNWTTENMELLREMVLGLLEETSEGIEVRYNFTHLSNILNIDKNDIYDKVIELYRGGNIGTSKENFNDTAKGGLRIDASRPQINESLIDSQPVSVDSLINIGSASKMLHSRHLLAYNIRRGGEESEESDEESVEESLLEREILETNI